MQSVYQKAIAKWGLSAQVSMAMGECGELIAALNRYFVQNRGEQYDVAEEIADVEIMCTQLREIIGHDLVNSIKMKKLERLEQIISGEINHPHT